MERFNHRVMRFIRRVFGSIWRSGASTHPDPILRDPHKRLHCRRSTKENRKGRKRLQSPPCYPGTITYRDWLVRHVGYDRRLADRMLRAWRQDPSIRMPLPTDSGTLRQITG